MEVIGVENKTIRKQLEKEYGKGCMFEKAHCEEQIEKLRTIKTFKKYLQEKRYRTNQIKRLRKQMTLHHFIHRSEGGKTTLENGGVVSELAHAYMHSLPRQHEEIINNMLREYKINIATLNGNGKIEKPQKIEIDMSDCIEIEVFDYDAKEKRKPKTRAKLKAEMENTRQEYVDR